jgi:glyoxylase I family protein
LELIPSEGERVELGLRSAGIRHLAIAVDDFDAGVKELESRGIEIFETIDGGANKLAFFRDMEGNILHLIWREKAF